ncbi:MAG TPA: aspartate aminotransferase family protein, partial [Herpetosiphonaceae bacterium]
SYADAKRLCDTERYGRFFHAMLERGVYFAPSQFEAGFLCVQHDDALIEQTLAAAREAMTSIR